jgi:hypothetical protein
MTIKNKPKFEIQRGEPSEKLHYWNLMHLQKKKLSYYSLVTATEFKVECPV